MVTSLASQLAQSASLNASVLSNARNKRVHTSTYLFDPKEGANHDLNSIYAISQNGFAALSAIDPAIGELGEDIFSTAARSVDRTLLPPDELTTLRTKLATFMRRTSQYILEVPTGKVIEWLVRRFRVNEFDVDLVLECFIPYHESIQFAKMLSILKIEANSMWTFLKPLQQNKMGLPRTTLVNEMIKNSDLARFVTNLVHQALGHGSLHRNLLNFATSTVIEYASRGPVQEAGIIAFVLPSITGPISTSKRKDVILAGFVMLSALVQRVRLTSKAVNAVIRTVLKAANQVTAREVVMVLIALSGASEEPVPLPDGILQAFSGDEKRYALLQTIPNALRWRGSEQFFTAFVSVVLQNRDPSNDWSLLVFTLVNSEAASDNLVQALASVLFQSMDSNSSDWVASVVSAVNQRHPAIFRLVAAKHASEMEDDARVAFEKTIADISIGDSVTGLGAGLLAANSDNVQVRLTGLKELLHALRDPQQEPSFVKRAAGQLIASLQDTSADVIKLVYDSSSLLLDHISPDQLLSTISAALESSHTPRATARLHLAFLGTEFCNKYPLRRTDVFLQAFPRFLLFTKPHQKIASAAWKVLQDSPLAELDAIAECFQWSHPDSEEMTKSNVAIAQQVAGNIHRSPNKDVYLEFIVSHLNDDDNHLRLFSLLAARAILLSASGDVALKLATTILGAMKLLSLDGLNNVLEQGQSLAEFASEESFAGTIASKPSSSSSHRRLQASILALIPGLPRPQACTIEWLRQVPESVTDPALDYVSIMRSIYYLANSTSSLHSLDLNLLRSIFISLKDESLMFLAGVWTAPTASTEIQRAALGHGKAYLVSQSSENTDFQVVLPALLVALTAAAREVRSAAMDCMVAMKEAVKERRASVHAVNSVYGERTDQVQILPTADLSTYLGSLIGRRDNFVADGGYLPVFHQDIFSVKNTTKRSSMHQRRVICFLLSHAAACGEFAIKLRIMSSLRHVSDATKVPFVAPLAEELLDASIDSFEKHQFGSAGDLLEEYCQLVFSTFDAAFVAVAESEDTGWATVIRAIRRSMDIDAIDGVRRSVLPQFQRVLFPHLEKSQKVEVCRLLVGLAIKTPDVRGYENVKLALPGLLSDSDTVIDLLPSLCIQLEPPQERNAKKLRLEDPGRSDEDLQLLRIFAEALTTARLSRSPDVIACLFDALHILCNASQMNISEMDYVLQALLTSLEKAINVVSDLSLPAGVLRVEVLVDLIRTTQNPQIFHQTLLVIGNIARLEAEAVLHHVMPIFTFVGTHVLHRDDSYSFRVVQKTVESVVPIMVKSLLSAHQERLSLLIESREFLRVFTSAASHIPRHRRVHFFNHLIEVLGPAIFLAPVVMLLVDRVANRVVRQEEEIQQTLYLPLHALAKHSHDFRLQVILEMLEESARLAINIDRLAGNEVPTYLTLALDEHAPSASIATKKQVLALLAFVGSALLAFGEHPRYKPKGSDPNRTIQRVMESLVKLCSIKLEIPSSEEEVREMAQKALIQVLRIIPASDFLRCVDALLATENTMIQSVALGLLTERLPLVSSNVRTSADQLMNTLVKRVTALLSSADKSIIRPALRAIGAVARTASANEHGSLVQSISPILGNAKTEEGASSDALVVLGDLTSKLGPRIITHIPVMITLSIDFISESTGLTTEAKKLLATIVSSIPAFLGDDIARIVQSCCAVQDRMEADTDVVLNAVISHIGARTLLPSIATLWSSEYADLKYGADDLEAFFRFTKSAITRAGRDDVNQNLKVLFRMFVDALDLRRRATLSEIDEVEAAVVTAFVELVSKLNEASFKPFFRRLYDWAFGASSTHIGKQIAFSHVMRQLINTFKSLILPYMALVLDSLCDTLEGFAKGAITDASLWLAVVDLLQPSFTFDEGVFWRDDRLERLMKPLVQQVAVGVKLDIDDRREALLPCLAEFGHSITSEDLFRSCNNVLLMETRAEDTRTQLFSLRALTSLWKRNSNRTAGLRMDTIAFIEDLAESENDDVAKEARVFKKLMDKARGASPMEVDE